MAVARPRHSGRGEGVVIACGAAIGAGVGSFSEAFHRVGFAMRENKKELKG